MTEPLPDLPQYRSHKIVRAAQIIAWTFKGMDRMRVLVMTSDGEQHTIKPPSNIFARGEPQVGDYLIVYEPDGYISFSPKAAFEAGYTKLDPDGKAGVMSDEPQHVHGQLWKALSALPLAWPPSMGPRERKAAIENVVIALDSLVAAKVQEALRSRPAERVPSSA